jgi:hypothetical protein
MQIHGRANPDMLLAPQFVEGALSVIYQQRVLLPVPESLPLFLKEMDHEA